MPFLSTTAAAVGRALGAWGRLPRWLVEFTKPGAKEARNGLDVLESFGSDWRPIAFCRHVNLSRPGARQIRFPVPI